MSILNDILKIYYISYRARCVLMGEPPNGAYLAIQISDGVHVFFIRALQLVQDYRALNAMTMKN